MQFPTTYFEDEVRDGFYIPAMMKRAWAAQLEVLADIAKVCEKHHIRWFADCGTLLGAVRHGGFVPWDDDLDICMLRDDYVRFRAVALKELPQNYQVLSGSKNEGWANLVTRVVNGNGVNFDAAHLEKYHDFPYVTGVDIMPLDYIARNPEDEALRKEVAKVVCDAAFSINKENQNLAVVQQTVAQIEEICGVTLDKNVPLQPQIFNLLENLFSLYRADEADEVALMYYWLEHDNHVYPKEYFSKCILMPFECTEVHVPVQYDDVLKIEYGEYMKINKKGECHDYPFYLAQEERVMCNVSKYPFRYQFSKEHLNRKPVETGRISGKEVVFIPYRASTWAAMEGVWKTAKEDENCRVYVVPVPYYDRDALGAIGNMHYDGEKFPDYVEITDYNRYDFAERKPDIIITQNPYDECHYTTIVHPAYYADKLKQYTPQLVYIPYFAIDEIEKDDEKAIANMRYYVTVPGVVHADKVIVQSENMRERYIDVLTDFAGEDTKEIWEKKILSIGLSQRVKNSDIDKKQVEMPDEWKRIIQKPDGSLKKVILYYTSVACLAQSEEKMLAKIQNVLQTFKEYQEEVALLWSPDALTQDVLENAYPQLRESYQKIVEEYESEGWGIFGDANDLDRAVMLCDAYYGDASSIVQRIRNAGKPVMLQDVNV